MERWEDMKGGGVGEIKRIGGDKRRRVEKWKMGRWGDRKGDGKRRR
jgi:hypothetical protein